MGRAPIPSDKNSPPCVATHLFISDKAVPIEGTIEVGCASIHRAAERLATRRFDASGSYKPFPFPRWEIKPPAGGLQKHSHLDDKNPRNMTTWLIDSPLRHTPYYRVRRGESGAGFLPEGAGSSLQLPTRPQAVRGSYPMGQVPAPRSL